MTLEPSNFKFLNNSVLVSHDYSSSDLFAFKHVPTALHLMHPSIVRAELKRRECNAMGHAFVCIRRPFEF